MQHNIEKRLRTVFKRVFRTEPGNELYSVDDIEEWDSLTHIKFVIELESEFRITIEPDEILSLYSNFYDVLNFLNQAVKE